MDTLLAAIGDVIGTINTVASLVTLWITLEEEKEGARKAAARPFVQKWGGARNDYEALYQQALTEMQQPDFWTTWKLLTLWGYKPV